ncbi:MAG: beta-galactosidase, partial [Kiritimatiellaeota bacterium]|nr:beta-galactosidase [Kiritimatiellota bacterium]
LCLSDAEARRIRAFCEAGGTVIADYLPGVWDQHGRGRPAGGALDEMFGVRHNPKMTAKDVFQGDGNLWCEVDQDLHYNDKAPEDLLRDNTCLMDVSGFHKAVRNASVAQSNVCGKGRAVLMNLSPMWYLAHRRQGAARAAKRNVFMRPIHDAGVSRWVQAEAPDGKAFGYEITYWEKAGRTILFLIMNADITVGPEGGGGALGLKTDTLPVTLTFARPVTDARDERTGKALGNGRTFPLRWKQNEACVISFGTP